MNCVGIAPLCEIKGLKFVYSQVYQYVIYNFPSCLSVSKQQSTIEKRSFERLFLTVIDIIGNN